MAETAIPLFFGQKLKRAEIRLQPSNDKTLAPDVKKYLKIDFWPYLVHSRAVELLSPDSAIERWEDPKSYSLLIETGWNINSFNPEKCRPSKLVCEIRISISSDLEGSLPMVNPTTLVGAWPKKELSLPTTLTRGVTSDNKFGVQLASGATQAHFGLSNKESWNLEVNQYVRRSEIIPGMPNNPRLVHFVVERTNSHPDIEGHHRFGIWISHEKKCYARISASVSVTAEMRTARNAWRKLSVKMQPLALPLSAPFVFAEVRRE